MPDKTEIPADDLPLLSPDVIDGLANLIQHAIKTAARATPGKPASDELKKLIAKRVPPKTLARYDTLDDYHIVAWDEAMAILERIFAYPYTVQYRKHLKGVPLDVGAAWQIHSHSLRGNELYIVQDRTEAFLGFLHVLAGECGLTTTDQTKAFENKFKKAFKRRLLQRHEVTHAHMRPSLVSRIINLNSAMARATPDEKEPMVTQFIEATAPVLGMLQELTGKNLTVAEVEQMHEAGAEREAQVMLDLFGRCVLTTLNIAMTGPAKDPRSSDDSRGE